MTAKEYLGIDFHDFIFSVDTLIKICRFYEGLGKVGKE